LFRKKAKLLGSEFLNLILALMNCQVVVVVIFLELATAVGLIESLETEDEIAEKVATMAVVAGTVAL
jgi:hypothetical protein